MLLHLPVRTFGGVQASLDTGLTACTVAVAPVPAVRIAIGARNGSVLDGCANVQITRRRKLLVSNIASFLG